MITTQEFLIWLTGYLEACADLSRNPETSTIREKLAQIKHGDTSEKSLLLDSRATHTVPPSQYIMDVSDEQWFNPVPGVYDDQEDTKIL